MDARQARDHRGRRRDGTAHRRARGIVLGTLIALLLAGCGSETGGDGPDGSAGGDQPARATEVTVTFWPDGRDGASQEAELTCDPDAGTHPDPAAACKALRANLDALSPLAPDSICTQIYGGPEEAEIAGTVNGVVIQATFSRQNGCEIDRWDRLATVLQLESP